LAAIDLPTRLNQAMLLRRVCVFYFHAGWLKPSPPFRLKDLLEERKKEEKEFLVLSIDRRPFFFSPVQNKGND
jgi:hypothetical protein